MLWLIAPLFIVISVCMCVWPTKTDPDRPGYKRRDWPVILILFCGGVAAAYLWASLMSLLPQGKFMKVAQYGADNGGTAGFLSLFYGILCVILVYCAIDEALLQPQAATTAGHEYKVQWEDVSYLTVLAILVFLYAFGVPRVFRAARID